MRLHLIILFFYITSFAQNNVVTYSYEIGHDDKIAESELLTKLFEKKRLAAKYVKFDLIFNDSIAVFKVQKTMESDQFDIDGAIAASRCKKEKYIYGGKTYQNNSESLFRENEYLIVDSLENNWQLTSETKTIDGYQCYKATTTFQVKNSNRIIHHPVIAWYCPEIPFQYGPAGYGGLPGMILQLQERFNVYGVEKIILNNKIAQKIEIPTEGELISYEAFNAKIASIMEDRFRNKN